MLFTGAGKFTQVNTERLGGFSLAFHDFEAMGVGARPSGISAKSYSPKFDYLSGNDGFKYKLVAADKGSFLSGTKSGKVNYLGDDFRDFFENCPYKAEENRLNKLKEKAELLQQTKKTKAEQNKLDREKAPRYTAGE